MEWVRLHRQYRMLSRSGFSARTAPRQLNQTNNRKYVGQRRTAYPQK